MTGLLSFLGQGSSGGSDIAADFSAISSTVRFQAFRLMIINDSGTIKHRIAASLDLLFSPATAGPLADRVNAATPSLTVTPNGTNATTPFAGGLKIDSAVNNWVYFDTAEQTVGNPLGVAIVADSTVTGADIMVVPGILSENINGVTRNRLMVTFEQAPGSAPFPITTSTIGNGKFLVVDFFGFLE